MSVQERRGRRCTNKVRARRRSKEWTEIPTQRTFTSTHMSHMSGNMDVITHITYCWCHVDVQFELLFLGKMKYGKREGEKEVGRGWEKRWRRNISVQNSLWSPLLESPRSIKILSWRFEFFPKDSTSLFEENTPNLHLSCSWITFSPFPFL